MSYNTEYSRSRTSVAVNIYGFTLSTQLWTLKTFIYGFFRSWNFSLWRKSWVRSCPWRVGHQMITVGKNCPKLCLCQGTICLCSLWFNFLKQFFLGNEVCLPEESHTVTFHTPQVFALFSHTYSWDSLTLPACTPFSIYLHQLTLT